MIKRLTPFIPVFIFIIAFLLRSNQPESWFEWSGNQSMYSWELRQLVNGNPTLVGFDAASIGGLRFPPFQLYLLAPIFLISHGNPMAMNVFFVVLGAITAVTFYYVGKALFGQKIGTISGILYTFSLGAIAVDRKFNGSTFMVILTLLSTFYLFKLTGQQKIKLHQVIILGSLIGLAFSMHYQTIFLLIAVTAILLWQKKLKFLSKNFGVFLLTIFLWLSPLLIFDFRHQFFTLRGIFLLQGSYLNHNMSLNGIIDSANYIIINFLNLIWKSIYLAFRDNLKNMGIVILTALLIIFSPLALKSGKKSDIILNFIVLLSFLGFSVLSFYKGTYNFDYYYWYLIPGFVFTLALLINRLIEYKLTPLVLLLFFAFLALNFKTMSVYRAPDSYEIFSDAVKSILADAKKHSEDKIVVRFAGIQPGQTDYLFYFNCQQFQIKPENITLIADHDLYVERTLTKLPPPVILLSKSVGFDMPAQYLFEKSTTGGSDRQTIYQSGRIKVYRN